MLELLLEVSDLPTGWAQVRETRSRVGFYGNEDRDRRARQQRLVSAVRMFVRADALSVVAALVSPAATEEDAQARLAARRGLWWTWPELIPPTMEETEVTPPPEAGEHARAFLTTIIPNEAASLRQLQVFWVEPGRPILGAVAFRAPAILDVWEFTAALVQRQRQRLVRVPAPGSSELGKFA
jgi:hypothetical protein